MGLGHLPLAFLMKQGQNKDAALVRTFMHSGVVLKNGNHQGLQRVFLFSLS